MILTVKPCAALACLVRFQIQFLSRFRFQFRTGKPNHIESESQLYQFGFGDDFFKLLKSIAASRSRTKTQTETQTEGFDVTLAITQALNVTINVADVCI